MTEASALLPAHFDADPVRIARGLLWGKLICVTSGRDRLTGRIVEVEAHDCPRDPACAAGRFHAARSADMATTPGRWLFWTAYGHPLLQVACRPEGVTASVLIRAIEPLEGVGQMLMNGPVTRECDLTSGPARLVYALGLEPALVAGTAVDSHTGLKRFQSMPWKDRHRFPSLCPVFCSFSLRSRLVFDSPQFRIRRCMCSHRSGPVPDGAVDVTARIDLREGRALPWRFLIRANPWVSPATPSVELSSTPTT